MRAVDDYHSDHVEECRVLYEAALSQDACAYNIVRMCYILKRNLHDWSMSQFVRARRSCARFIGWLFTSAKDVVCEIPEMGID